MRGMLAGRNGNHAPMRGGQVIGLVSAKGSPGVTTTALGLAARWPQPGAVVVEADPAGGDLAARFGRHAEPGLATMALASRHNPGGERDPGLWMQPLDCGVDVVLAPPGPAAVARLTELAGRGAPLLQALAGQRPVVLVDGGRWRPGSAADPLLAAADLTLVLARPVLAEICQLQVRLAALASGRADVWLLLVGDGGWPLSEIAAVLSLNPWAGFSDGLPNVG
jgi:hypothetical protein